MRPLLLFVALSAVLLGACYSAGDGAPPPLDSIYFPTGLALDVIPKSSSDPSVAPDPPGAPAHLFVASSDFDLQYRASALASYDLDTLARKYLPQNCNVDADCSDGKVCDSTQAQLPRAATLSQAPSYFCVEPPGADGVTPCGSLGEHHPWDLLLYPGRCASIDPTIATDVIDNAVQIGAFATDVIFKPTGDGGDTTDYTGRLFLPVRGDATLHWVDVDPGGGLHCGQENTSDDSCDDLHRVGDDEYTESPNLLRQEPEPFAIAIDDAGENIAVTNQTTGSVSLYVNPWTKDPLVPPQLVALAGGLPSAPVGITALPTPKLVDQSAYQPGFLTVYRDASQVDLLRVQADLPSAQNPGPYDVRVLTRAGSVPINANSVGSDSRGIVVDDSQRQADYRVCEKPCSGLADAALAACEQSLGPCFQAVHQPSVYVSNRAPASLLIGALTPDFSYASGTSELPAFTNSIPVALGASRVVLGKVRVASNAPDAIQDSSGNYVLEQRVFVVCFDSRRIYIYDPVRAVIDSVVITGRGPFALTIDEARGLGYVAHFTDSYLGVISLDQRFPQNYAAIIASIGIPTPPRASK
jgi:hypothetical protein